MILVFQTIGGSVFVSAAQSAFANTLLSSLKSNAPLVNSAKVLATGATDIRTSFAGEEIAGIVLSYLDGLHVVFALSITLSGLSLIVALFAPWKRVNVRDVLKQVDKPA
jgi:MFS transporter, DHA2 family, glioxin efflux transporter